MAEQTVFRNKITYRHHQQNMASRPLPLVARALRDRRGRLCFCFALSRRKTKNLSPSGRVWKSFASISSVRVSGLSFGLIFPSQKIRPKTVSDGLRMAAVPSSMPLDPHDYSVCDICGDAGSGALLTQWPPLALWDSNRCSACQLLKTMHGLISAKRPVLLYS